MCLDGGVILVPSHSCGDKSNHGNLDLVKSAVLVFIFMSHYSVMCSWAAIFIAYCYR